MRCYGTHSGLAAAADPFFLFFFLGSSSSNSLSLAPRFRFLSDLSPLPDLPGLFLAFTGAPLDTALIRQRWKEESESTQRAGTEGGTDLQMMKQQIMTSLWAQLQTGRDLHPAFGCVYQPTTDTKPHEDMLYNAQWCWVNDEGPTIS